MKHIYAVISSDPSQTPYQRWSLSLCSPGHWWRQSRTAPAERRSCPRRGWWWTRRSASSRSRSSPTCTACWRSSGSTWRCSKPGPCGRDEARVNQRSGEHFTWLTEWCKRDTTSDSRQEDQQRLADDPKLLIVRLQRSQITHSYSRRF